MKISILTQPLGHNYGGLLQAYALQAHLRAQGHEVETLDRRKPEESGLITLKTHVRNTLRYALGRIKTIPTRKKEAFVYLKLADFRDRHIRMSRRIDSQATLRDYYRQRPVDAVIVGSDQVWRPRYSPSLPNFFLDFLDDVEMRGRPAARRISYAASFGVDAWEFSPEQTAICKSLAQKFDAISVREQSAQALCREHLGVDAEWVVDPTLLLAASDYDKLMPAGTSQHKGKVLTYVLDSAEDKQAIAGKVAAVLKAELFSVKPQKALTEVAASQQQQCQYPGVDEWLQGFRDAAFVVTDSFHGCVFSIIFNKPFVAVGNAKRGLSRFHSLLKIFGLEDRLISSAEQITPGLITAAIDWDIVNRIRQTKAQEAQAFLVRNLPCSGARPEHGSAQVEQRLAGTERSHVN